MVSKCRLQIAVIICQGFLIIKALSSDTLTHPETLCTNTIIIIIGSRTHGGVCGAVPVRDGHVVVLEFARDPFPGFGFPQKRVEVREVVMDVQTVLTPSAQRPAAELRALRNQKPDETRSHCIRDDFNPCWYNQWMLLLKPALNWSKVAVL